MFIEDGTGFCHRNGSNSVDNTILQWQVRSVSTDPLYTKACLSLLAFAQHLSGQVDSQGKFGSWGDKFEKFACSASDVDDYVELSFSDDLQYLCVFLVLLFAVELVVIPG